MKVQLPSPSRMATEVLWATGTVTAALLVARAAPGGEEPVRLAVAGTLHGSNGQVPQGARALDFTFRNASGATCRVPNVQVTGDPASGAFRSALDLGSCGQGLFDAEGVTVDVSIDGAPVVDRQPIGSQPIALHAEASGSAPCPVGYERPATDLVCRNGADEVVKVGEGAAAFWIDRFEASIWTLRFGTGSQVSAEGDLYPASFPKNGQIANRDTLFAASVAGVSPNRFLSWFQASAACRASGKRLPRGDEWLAAARGTLDPGSAGGSDGACNTASNGVRATGLGSACASASGAQDMVGNLWEWTADWHAAISSRTVAPFAPLGFWPPGFGDDAAGHIESKALSESAWRTGLPSAALRGGAWDSGLLGGKFSLNLAYAPSSAAASIGVRCVVER